MLWEIAMRATLQLEAAMPATYPLRKASAGSWPN